MNFFILLLLIPLSFAETAPGCADLEKYIADYEKELQKKHINKCDEVNVNALIGERPVVNRDFLKGQECSDLTTIETQLENLKIQEAVLTGIQKLKATLKVSKQETKNKNEKVQNVAGMKFVDSLKTAQSLETLLNTNFGDDKVPLIKLLKDQSGLTPENLQSTVRSICKTHKIKTYACDQKIFSVEGEVAVELVSLINSTKPTPDKIKKWQEALAIEKSNPAEDEDPAYSFTQMHQELGTAFSKIDNKEVLTKRQITAIQNLPDIKDPKEFSFLKNIASLKDEKSKKIESDKFFLLMGDAKKRQEFEIKTKLSVALGQMDLSVLSVDEKSKCERSKIDFQEARSCLTALEANLAKMDKDTKANTARLLPKLRTASDYVDFLDNKITACEVSIKNEDQATDPCFGAFNQDLASVQDQILQLNILKDKIGEENTDLMTFRNFAMTKWGSQKCQGSVSSPMDFCEDNISISKEANLIYSNIMDITILFSPKPEAESEAEEICAEEDRKFTKTEESLCNFFKEPSSNIVKTDNAKLDVDGPVAAPDGGHEQAALRDAWIQGSSNVLAQALSGMLNNQYRNQYMNPYQYNYAPWGGTGRPMGIADSIMFNARYYGAYGFYMPTPGYQPYTAFGTTSFGTATTAYTSVGNSAGKYFGF